MSVRFPTPLRPGHRIAVTAPSAGVPDALKPRLEFALRLLRETGYDVVVGECLDVNGVTSAPAEARAAELTSLLLDPGVRAVVPPWGGELGVDLLPHLDFDALRAAEPTWLVGYSDTSTLLLPLTLLTGTATVHGENLMDTPYDVPPPLLHWLDVITRPAGTAFEQGPGTAHRTTGFDDWAADPAVRHRDLDTATAWRVLDQDTPNLDVEGRLLGGCLETVALLPGTPYGDVAGFADQHAPEGLLVYLEVADADAMTVARMLHHLRLAGWFDRANAVLMGRSRGPSVGLFTQTDAVRHALGDLHIPIVLDADIGHLPPQMTLLNGALARLEFSSDTVSIRQDLG